MTHLKTKIQQMNLKMESLKTLSLPMQLLIGQSDRLVIGRLRVQVPPSALGCKPCISFYISSVLSRIFLFKKILCWYWCNQQHIAEVTGSNPVLGIIPRQLSWQSARTISEKQRRRCKSVIPTFIWLYWCKWEHTLKIDIKRQRFKSSI